MLGNLYQQSLKTQKETDTKLIISARDSTFADTNGGPSINVPAVILELELMPQHRFLGGLGKGNCLQASLFQNVVHSY